MDGVLVCISGPSGVGKSTICRLLTERFNAFLSVSATTRPPRDNEVHGRDYYFIDRAEFEVGIKEGRWLEYAEVYGGHYYGTPAEPVEQELAAGRVVILEIEIEGTIQAQNKHPDLIGIYLLAPSPRAQADRLLGRRKDSEEAIRERLSKADGEIRYAQDCGAYQHFVINEVIEDTVERITRIIEEKRNT